MDLRYICGNTCRHGRTFLLGTACDVFISALTTRSNTLGVSGKSQVLVIIFHHMRTHVNVQTTQIIYISVYIYTRIKSSLLNKWGKRTLIYPQAWVQSIFSGKYWFIKLSFVVGGLNMLNRAYFSGFYRINLAQLKEEHRAATKPK